MPWWEEAPDIVGLSRPRINAFIMVVGIVAMVVLGFLYRGTGMVGALGCVAVGVVLAITSLIVRQRKGPSWLLRLLLRKELIEVLALGSGFDQLPELGLAA